MYGNATAPVLVADCTVQPPLQGSVVVQLELAHDYAQYLIHTPSGCAILVTTARFPVWHEGDRLQLSGKAPQAVNTLGPEQAGYVQYLQRREVHALWRYPRITAIAVAPAHTSFVDQVAARINHLFPEPAASVVQALLLANDDSLPESLKEHFRITGLSHLLAISGSNISLLAGVLVGILYFFPLSPLVRTIVLALFLWIYMALLDWPISAVRAAFFWTFALLALRLHLLMSLPNILLLTLVFMTSLQPGLTSDISFQLSVSAVIGIYVMLFLSKRYLVRSPAWVKVGAGALVLTLGATLMTLPVSIYHFGTLSLIGVLANLLVAPIVGVQMVTALFAVLLSFVSPALALLPSFIVQLTVRWMEIVSSSLARIPGVYWENLQLPGYGVAIYYLVIALICVGILRHQHRSWREVWG